MASRAGKSAVLLAALLFCAPAIADDWAVLSWQLCSCFRADRRPLWIRHRSIAAPYWPDKRTSARLIERPSLVNCYPSVV